MTRHITTRLSYVVLTAFMVASCTDKGNNQTTATAEADSEIENPVDSATLAAKDWDELNAPMYMTNAGEHILLHVYDSTEDSLQYAPIAERYSTLIEDGKSYKISFAEHHKGKSIGNIIGGEYASHMSGIYYNIEGYKDEYPGGYAFTSQFMSEHQSIPFKTFPEGAEAPASIIEKAKQHYNGNVKYSWKCAESLDKTVGVYRLQFQPVDSTCIGMLLVADGDQIYTSNDTAYCYDGDFTWHVDDDGVYGPISVSAITRGAKGLDIFCVDYACESISPFAILARGSEMHSYYFANYYVYIDYTPQPEPVELPKTAELRSECDGFKVWVDEEQAPTEDDPAGLYSVYYSGPESENVYLVASNHKNQEAQEMLMQHPWPMFVGKDELLSCSDAVLVKNPRGDVYLIVGGCPDARNLFNYMIGLPTWSEVQSLRWIPTNNGFYGLDDSGELLKTANYGYNDEGRYAVYRYYDFDMNLVREEPYEE